MSSKKCKVKKQQFDEYGWRMLGDEDELPDATVEDPKEAASKGCKASNDANRTLLPAEEQKKE